MYLNCHSYYSLRFGTFSEIELLEMAAAHGIKSLALTDINNTSACLNFIRKAKDFGIKPIVGIVLEMVQANGLLESQETMRAFMSSTAFCLSFQLISRQFRIWLRSLRMCLLFTL